MRNYNAEQREIQVINSAFHHMFQKDKENDFQREINISLLNISVTGSAFGIESKILIIFANKIHTMRV